MYMSIRDNQSCKVLIVLICNPVTSSYLFHCFLVWLPFRASTHILHHSRMLSIRFRQFWASIA